MPTLERLLADCGVHTFYNARAALYHVAITLAARGRRAILVPAFHCPSVIEPLLRGGLEPRFYRIGRNLQIDLDDLRHQLDASDLSAALFINYFGFPSAFESVMPDLQTRGILAIEDCAHSFLTTAPLGLSGRRADLAVYSFKKLVPSLAGGGLWVKPGVDIPGPRLVRPPFRDSVVRAKHLVDELVHGLGAESQVRRWYKAADGVRARLRGANSPSRSSAGDSEGMSQLLKEYFFDERLARSRMPWLAEKILWRANLSEIAESRRRNYQVLIDGLRDVGPQSRLPIDLPDAVCPWAYPSLMRDRSNYDLRLRAQGVPVWTFGNNLHRIVNAITRRETLEDARFLADNLLCFSVHQGLSAADSERVVELTNSFLQAQVGACQSI